MKTGVSLTCPFLTCRVRSALLVPEGKTALKARKAVEVRMATQVLWDPQGRKYVTQGARLLPFLVASRVSAGDSVPLSPLDGGGVVPAQVSIPFPLP